VWWEDGLSIDVSHEAMRGSFGVVGVQASKHPLAYA
jgi:hypothetical protein